MSKQTLLTADEIEDLIYSARAGDLAALKEDITTQSQAHTCSAAQIVASAIDDEPESEGGTGCCLLHYPAANGSLEILSYLLSTLESAENKESVSAVLNHRNHSGNTPLHWAALNTHLECVKALVAAGADVTAKNDAGLDAVFLAERTAWASEEGEKKEAEMEKREAEGEEASTAEMSAGRLVVDWLLGSEKGGELESGAGISAGDVGASATGASVEEK